MAKIYSQKHKVVEKRPFVYYKENSIRHWSPLPLYGENFSTRYFQDFQRPYQFHYEWKSWRHRTYPIQINSHSQWALSSQYLLPEMKPGKHKGKEVDVPYSIPISFRLESTATSSNLDSKALQNGFNLTSSENIKAVYFVDGIETSIDSVRKINPDILESIAVLKGKAAEDKYGEKGKNGVVEITLKMKE